jgi:hypothetical protein
MSSTLTLAHYFHHQIIASQFTDERKKHDRFGAELQYLKEKCRAENPLERLPATQILQKFQEFKAAHPEDTGGADRSHSSNESRG